MFEEAFKAVQNNAKQCYLNNVAAHIESNNGVFIAPVFGGISYSVKNFCNKLALPFEFGWAALTGSQPRDAVENNVVLPESWKNTDLGKDLQDAINTKFAAIEQRTKSNIAFYSLEFEKAGQLKAAASHAEAKAAKIQLPAGLDSPGIVSAAGSAVETIANVGALAAGAVLLKSNPQIIAGVEKNLLGSAADALAPIIQQIPGVAKTVEVAAKV